MTLETAPSLFPERALAAIYARAIERFQEVEEGSPETAPDSAKKGSDESSAKIRIP